MRDVGVNLRCVASDFASALVFCERLMKSTLLHVGEPEAQVGSYEILIEYQSALVLLNSFVVSPLVIIDAAEINVYDQLQRIKLQCTLHFRARIVQPAHRQKVQAAPMMQQRLIWVQADPFLKLLVRPCPIPLVETFDLAQR